MSAERDVLNPTPNIRHSLSHALMLFIKEPIDVPPAFAGHGDEALPEFSCRVPHLIGRSDLPSAPLICVAPHLPPDDRVDGKNEGGSCDPVRRCCRRVA